MIPTNTTLCGDALATLKTLPNSCVQMVCTSPPYWRQRDYGVPGQLGLEASYTEYIPKLCDIFDEVKRVLKADGTCWVTIGDGYSGNGGRGRSPRIVNPKMGRFGVRLPAVPRTDLPPKSLCLIPARFAVEMVRRGWRLRNVIIWQKPNAVPESVRDRFTIDFEYLFFFTKSRHYSFNQQFEPATNKGTRCAQGCMRHRRCVWTIPTTGYPGNHFVVYPVQLIETPIRAGSAESDIVLDPFLGTGTTAVVAFACGSRSISSTRLPRRANAAARLTFLLAIALLPDAFKRWALR